MELRPKDEVFLKRVHPDLVKVVRRAAALLNDPEFGFIITCGIRTVAEQREMVRKGASKTMRSRHLPGKAGYACAVDIAVTDKGKVKWDWPLYVKFAKIMKQAAKDVGVPIEAGVDWVKFRDGPHFQLPWKFYP